MGRLAGAARLQQLTGVGGGRTTTAYTAWSLGPALVRRQGWLAERWLAGWLAGYWSGKEGQPHNNHLERPPGGQVRLWLRGHVRGRS